MLSPENQRLADDFRNLYQFSKEIGRNLSLASPDAQAMGCRNALHVLNFRVLSTPEEMAVALCEPEAPEAAPDAPAAPAIETDPDPAPAKRKTKKDNERAVSSEA
jgi:hypothetical protein